jgi:hypothetical protein
MALMVPMEKLAHKGCKARKVILGKQAQQGLMAQME